MQAQTGLGSWLTYYLPLIVTALTALQLWYTSEPPPDVIHKHTQGGSEVLHYSYVGMVKITGLLLYSLVLESFIINTFTSGTRACAPRCTL